MKIGASYLGGNTAEFTVWSPLSQSIALKIVSQNGRLLPLEPFDRGYWKTTVSGIPPGSDYLFVINDALERPDPASHFQPQGVHGPSRLIDHAAFAWDASCRPGVNLDDYIMYELHTGTFSPEGTFAGVLSRLDYLVSLGVTAIELMPVAQFPGERNWGYDGAYPFAVQNSYGGPEALKELVNACHVRGLAFILDVVYNHFGPEGCYVRDFGPYFTSKYKTPWGDAVNFDDQYNDGVRNYFFENARHWFLRYQVDALRLDAVHSILDFSAQPFLQQLAEMVSEISRHSGRRLYLIAESDLNDVTLVRPRTLNGYGLDAQWSDDVHHCVHSLLTGENKGYYHDFGSVVQLVKAYREGMVYTGQYSRYRKKSYGNDPRDIAASQFVVCDQNHDQIGNRMLGERLSKLVPFESLKVAAGLIVLSPYLPLLFMGEEFGEEAPFLYFVDHGDPDLIRAVRAGRRDEFKEFLWEGEPPDPENPETFARSRIRWDDSGTGNHKLLGSFYRELIRLRKTIPVLAVPDNRGINVQGSDATRSFFWERTGDDRVFAMFNFSAEARRSPFPVPDGSWERLIDSSDISWGGPGALSKENCRASDEIVLQTNSFALYTQE